MQPLATEDPSVIGSYRLLGRLGAGGMGRVFLGRSPGGRTVAVKMVRAELADDGEFRDRFRREVAAARRVGGSWTAPVLDADTDSDDPWVATGYVAGPALADAVAEFGPLSERGARALTAGLAEALVAVHGLGLIHRDIKPSNVMLSPDGPVLIDFGIARAMDGATTANLTRTGMVVGSPGYMSPEQVQGLALGAASDVFQLGAVLVHAVTGRGPFVADSAAALLYKVAHGEPELGAMQGELRLVAEACLAKDPAARPTPQQIAARLAPQGASALVRQGWLAEPLMAQLSRRMVELLNLDAAPEAGPQDRPVTPPVRTVQLAKPTPPPHPPTSPEPAREPVRERYVRPAGRPLSPLIERRSWADRHGRKALLAVVGILVVVGSTVALTHTSTPTADTRAFLGKWTGTVEGSITMDGELELTVYRSDNSTDTRASGVYHLRNGAVCQVQYQVQPETGEKIGLYDGVVPGLQSGLCSVIGSQAHLSRQADGTLTYDVSAGGGGLGTGHLTLSA